MHLLVTSRPEEDIAKHLRSLDSDHVNIKQDLVSRDVERYINSILYDEDSFEQCGDEMMAKIKNTVLERAGEMYAIFHCTKR